MAQGIARATRQRIVLALIGSAAGICFYVLAEQLNGSVLNAHLYLLVATFAAVFFGGLLAIEGPLPLGRAAASALALAVPVAILLFWASFRYDDPSDIFRSAHEVLALVAISTLPLPFLISAAGPDEDWHDYTVLFSQSWNIVVRYASAWLFVAVIWAVLLLSDALFKLVGLRVIDDLINLPVVPYVLTGFALGLALSVVNELSDFVSPYLILRLLRLLVPVVPAVTGIFLLALVLRGMSSLPGGISVAGTLLTMASGALLLISTALDASDSEAVETPLMLWSVQALALMLPFLAGLAAWAVWLRVAEYGWTPARLAASLAALVMLGYGLLYAAAVILRSGWKQQVRRANTIMALVVIACATLWLTPVLNANRISAQSQVSRFLAGKVPADRLDILALRQGWGRAGEAALARLNALAAQPGHSDLHDILNRTASTPVPVKARPDATKLDAATLKSLLPVEPSPAPGMVDQILTIAAPEDLNRWLAACESKLSNGAPGCVLIHGDFLPDRVGEEAILAYRDTTGFLEFEGFTRFEGAGVLHATVSTLLTAETGGINAEQALIRLQSGEIRPSPAHINTLTLQDRQIFLMP